MYLLVSSSSESETIVNYSSELIARLEVEASLEISSLEKSWSQQNFCSAICWDYMLHLYFSTAIILVLIYFSLFFLIQGFPVQTWRSWNLLGRPDWYQTQRPTSLWFPSAGIKGVGDCCSGHFFLQLWYFSEHLENMGL